MSSSFFKRVWKCFVVANFALAVVIHQAITRNPTPEMILGLPFYAQNCFIISFCLSCRAIKHKPFRLISIVSFIIGWGFLGWFFTHTTNIPMRKGHKPFTLADLEVVVYIAIAHWVYDTMKGKTYGFIITIASLILGSVFLRIALTNTLMKNGTAGQLLLHFSHSHH